MEEKMRSGKYIIASGPVIVEDGKVLVSRDTKDPFFKLPGGTIDYDNEDLEECAKREAKEKANAKIEIIKPLRPHVLWKNPKTNEPMAIVLINYEAKLLNKEEIRPIEPVQEIAWLDIGEIKAGKHNVSPNIKTLLEREF